MATDIRATYRLQLRPGFGFARARQTLPYLQRLGVTHLYLSPILAPREGSEHGYDTVDPTRLNPELGSRNDFDALAAGCRERGMGLVLDVVPNHMAASEQNPWWRDVLAQGRQSTFASYFDVDWAREGGKVFLPILGQPYGHALKAGELRPAVVGQEIVLQYYDRDLPLSPSSQSSLLDAAPIAAPVQPPESALNVPEHADEVKSWLAGLPAPDIHQLVLEQHYIPGYWRAASERVNYRRFFDIGDLAAVRVEDPEVFEATHAFLRDLAADEVVAGFRIDHVDGMRDPAAYLARFEQDVARGRPVWVEKILGSGEQLPEHWATVGTTGYEVAGLVDRLLAPGQGVARLSAQYEKLTGDAASFADQIRRAKREVIGELFAADLRQLAGLFMEVARSHPSGVDLTLPDAADAIAALTAELPRYRTYLGDAGLTEDDRNVLQGAVLAAARNANPEALALVAETIASADDPRASEFARRWQQFTGPVAAKGLEDTALYRDHRLLSLNDVGRSPGEDEASVSRDDFHVDMRQRVAQWPMAMTASSTHDSKRSEDVRYRLAALAEMPEAWRKFFLRSRRMNATLAGSEAEVRVPSAPFEWGLYQAIIGTWPGVEHVNGNYVARLREYAVKGAREAGQATSWLNPNEPYETALRDWISRVLDPGRAEFLEVVSDFAGRAAWHGALNGLGASMLKLTLPGIPDFYQGTEMLALNLVDPDNRRAVDFERLDHTLTALPTSPSPPSWWRQALPDGRAKLRVVAEGLRLRARYPDLFTHGDYEPLRVEGERADNVVAYRRRHDTGTVVVVVPRFTADLCRRGSLPIGKAAWGGTTVLLPGSTASALSPASGGAVVPVSGGGFAVAQALAKTPVGAFLEPSEGMPGLSH